ncbi:MAG TPA: hypothetical protein VGW38_19450 [Chloroflexota bacterium]|nr:hypothetical protein [Chloroflexota bacterium]
MTVQVRDSTGAPKDVADILVRDSAGLLKTASSAWIRTAEGLKQFFGQFTVSNSGDVDTSVNSAGTVKATTRPVTVTVEGAVGAVTYAWTKLTGGAWTINNPSSAETTFSINVAPLVQEVGTFRCTVTDSGGHSGTTDVTASAVNMYGGFQ